MRKFLSSDVSDNLTTTRLPHTETPAKHYRQQATAHFTSAQCKLWTKQRCANYTWHRIILGEYWCSQFKRKRKKTFRKCWHTLWTRFSYKINHWGQVKKKAGWCNNGLSCVVMNGHIFTRVTRCWEIIRRFQVWFLILFFLSTYALLYTPNSTLIKLWTIIPFQQCCTNISSCS